MSNSDEKTAPHAASPHAKGDEELEEYQGGLIQAHHGGIQPWLLVVYFGLFVWALYYLYTYWGGLGPGLDYAR